MVSENNSLFDSLSFNNSVVLFVYKLYVDFSIYAHIPLVNESKLLLHSFAHL